MKKNFFKKLSFVLALAMIVSVLAPAAGAFAASAPKLNVKTTKYLYLGTDKNEFDFNIANKQKGWKYLWSSANEDVATVNEKNGVTLATGAGTTKVSVVITDADGEEVDELTATVTVRDNIKELTITNTPADGKLAVGVSNDFNRSYVTVAGKKSGSKAITRWSVSPSVGATISDAGLFTATVAGEYTITARSFQSKAKYTSWLADATKYASYVTSNEATYKVTVASSMTGVKQTTLAAAAVTFDSAMTDVAKNISVYQLVGTTKVKQLVKEVKMDDAKKVATVTLFVNFAQEATYVIDYPNMKSVQFVAARAKAEDVKTMEISTKTAVLNTAKTVEVKLLNADGVDISAGTGLNDRVTMTSTGEANTSFSGKTLYMYKKDVTTTVKAVFHTYKYSSTGAEEGLIEAAGVITCVESDPTNVSGLNAWTIKGASETPDYASPTHTIATGDSGKKLFVKLNTLTGSTTSTVDSVANASNFEFESSDKSILMIYSGGLLVPNKEGNVTIVVKYGTGTTKTAVATVEITVGAKRAASQFSLNAYEFTLSNNIALADSKELAITLKDQFNADFAYTTYDAEKISGPASAVFATGTNLSPATGGKITFYGAASGVAALEGTYVYKITVKDLVKVVTVTVVTPSETTAQYWRLDLSANSVDLKSASEKVNKDVTLAIYGYANNGIKVSKPALDNTAFKIKVDAPSATINYSEANSDGSFDLVTSTSGGAIVKRPLGSYKVTAYRWDPTVTASDKWVPVDTQLFATSDTQVAPILGEVKTKLHDTSITTYSAVDAALIAAVKECYKITLDGADVSANIVSVEANGTYTSTYVTSVTVRTYFKINDASANTAYLDQKVTIGDYITKK